MKKLLISLLPGYAQRALSWRTSDHKNIRGTLVKGDLNTRPSSGSRLPMTVIRLTWKMVAVITVESGGKPFYVGYQDPVGQAHLCDCPLMGAGFRAKVGREDVLFFVIDADGVELPIRNVVVLPQKEAAQFKDKDFPRI